MICGTILTLGDSLTAGARAEHDGHAGLGFPEWLPPILDHLMPGDGSVEPMEWAVLNRGISGQTTRQILDRAPGAFRELQGCFGAKWAVVIAGTNDSKAAPPIVEWEALYRQIVHWARRFDIPVLLGTFPPVVPAAMPAYSARSVAWLAEASDRVRAIAAELDGRPSRVGVLELADLGTEYLVDGVHLTPAGYREVAVRVAAAMTEAPVDEVRARAPEVPEGRFASLLSACQPIPLAPQPSRKRR